MKENIKAIITIIIGVVLIALALVFFRNPKPTPPNQPNELTKNPGQATNSTGLPLNLPAGFSISTYASGLTAPRMISFDNNGVMLVSITSKGKVVALPDKDNSNQSDQTIEVLTGLRNPHGLFVNCDSTCKLYVAEENQLAVYDYDSVNLKATNKKKLMDLPAGAGHFTRTIKLGPDGRIYLSIGSSCNVCIETDTRRAKIFSLKTDGSDLQQVASGLRNAVSFTWNSAGQMWATDNGRDYLGDNLPPDDVNLIQAGKNYGWPICYGQNIHDTNFDHNQYIRDPCADDVPTTVELQAHSAPLGLDFAPNNWPKDWQNNLVVAFHGSWNRTQPTGYKLVRIKLDSKGNYVGTEDFITGFRTSQVLARPVDVESHNGALYVSDDKAGNIYRITYAK